MDCRELKELMDSYIGDELLVETNHEVLRHIENCRRCRDELGERRALRERLRHALRNSDATRIDPAFVLSQVASLRETALRPGLWERLTGGPEFVGKRLIAFSFACLLLLGLGGIVLLNRGGKADEASALAAALKLSWEEMISQAIDDHKNCAIKFNLTEKPVSLDQAAIRFGAFNKDLDKTITTAVGAVLKGTAPEGIEFLEAHNCLFEGRRFAHIVLKQKGRVVSVLVTDTDLPGGGENVEAAQFDGPINAVGFHLGHHAVFVVSEMSKTENAVIAKSLVSALRLHGQKVGA